MHLLSLALTLFSLGIAIWSIVVSRKRERAAQAMLKHLHHDSDQKSLSWNDYGRGLRRLEVMLLQGARPFTPEVLIGVGGGGVAIADMLSVRFYEHTSTLPSVHAVFVQKQYRQSAKNPPETTDDDLKRWVQNKNVLLVEDFFLSGESLIRLIDRIKLQSPRELRVAVFTVPKTYVGKDDVPKVGNHIIHYSCSISTNAQFTMPWGRS